VAKRHQILDVMDARDHAVKPARRRQMMSLELLDRTSFAAAPTVAIERSEACSRPDVLTRQLDPNRVAAGRAAEHPARPRQRAIARRNPATRKDRLQWRPIRTGNRDQLEQTHVSIAGRQSDTVL
jgi:hypothetical protein